MSESRKRELSDAAGAGYTDRRTFLGRAGAVLTACAAAPFIARPALAQKIDAGPVVETHYGKLRGTVRKGIHSFKGISYGASTAGKNRFMPPVKPEAWAGVREAIQFGHWSPQNFQYHELEAPQADIQVEGTSEDCLVLNIWTPQPSTGRKRPVMFWNHGGGWSSESGSNPWVDGEALARRGDVVVVTINHRLNLFGCCHLGDIGGEKYSASGLAGMLDIVAALEWVRDNIAQFGGDPGNVLVFGESGGASKTHSLLAMPKAKGLFHRAAMESGGGAGGGRTRDQANQSARALMAQLGIPANRADDMQTVPMKKLLAAMSAMGQQGRGGAGGGQPFSPFVDGVIVPADTFDPVATPVSDTIPILIGTNLTEQALFAWNGQDRPAFDLDEDGLRQRAKGFVGEQKAAQLFDLYMQRNPAKSISDIYFKMFTDRGMRGAAITAAERKFQQGKAPVYMYLFEWQSPALNGILGSPHTAEMPFVWDNTEIPRLISTGSPAEKALAARVSEAWIQFARTGNPSHKGLPNWPAYTTPDRATMVLNNECAVVKDPRSEERRFWQSV